MAKGRAQVNETGLAAGTSSVPLNAAPRLVIGCYRLKFNSATPIRFLGFSGSAWRGALGPAKMRKYDQVPHPFTLRLEEIVERACTLRAHLFGRGNGYLPLFVAALRQAGQSPKGIGGNRLVLESV